MEGGSTTVTSSDNGSFVKHVFNFDNDTKNELMNMIQYLLLAIIPLTFFNNLICSFIPEVDESKGNFDLLSEIVLHLILTILSIYLVNRIITFVPTYSGRTLDNVNFINIALVLLMFNRKSKTKLDVLFKRVKTMWDGEEPTNKKKSKKNGNQPVVKVSQPITGGAATPTRGPNSADYLKAHAQMNAPNSDADPGTNNNMYSHNGFNGLQNAQIPTMQEPMAANSFGGFSSW